MESHDQRIRALVNAWAAAVRARNLDGVVASHSEDIVMFDVTPPLQLRGLTEYRASWIRFFRWFGDGGLFDVLELDVACADEVAFCRGLIRCRAAKAQPFEDLDVRLTMGLRRIEGRWTIVHEHHSTPSTPA